MSPLHLSRALALLALSCCAVTARADGLRLAVEPPGLLLCAGKVAAVTVSGTGGRPFVTASAGRVERLREEEPGTWRVDYLPPDTCFPQVAVVSAVGPAGWVWAVVPLTGQGDALVKTAPRATLTVRIGERTFGPATADAAGRALVPVVVPPGVHTALHGRREIPLDLPPPRRVHVALDRPAGPADRQVEVRVRLFVVEEDGAPGDTAPLRVSVTDGVLSALAPVARGVAEATWTLPPGPSGPRGLTATLPGEAGEAGFASLERPPGPPARIVVTASPADAEAGGEVQVRAQVSDAAGNASEARAALTASAGEVTRWEAAPGGWSGAVRVPGRLPGERSLALEVRAGEAKGQAVVTLAAQAPARLTVTVPAGAIPADGRGGLALGVWAEDALGNAAEGPPSLRAEQGTLSAPERDGAGGWRVAYRPPVLERDGIDRVVAGLGAARGGGEIRLLARPPRFTVAIRGGVAWRAGGMTGAAGVEGAWWPAALRGRAALALEAGWTEFRRADALDLGGATTSLRGRADFLPLAATLLGQARLGAFAIGWLGAGGGVALVRAAVPVAGLPQAAETGTSPEAHLAAGVGWRLGPGWAFLEVRETWLGEPSVASLSGNLRVHSTCMGYRHALR